MSLSDLAALGSFVSGLAVLASLVYLALQLKQTERNQVAAIKQGRSNRLVSINLARLEPSAAMAIRKGLIGSDDITDEQLEQFRAWCVVTFLGGEDSFSQHAEGLLDENSFSSFAAGHKVLLGNPGLRVAWKQMRGAWPNEFGAYYDRLLADVPVSLLYENNNESWRAAVAAERSNAGMAQPTVRMLRLPIA